MSRFVKPSVFITGRIGRLGGARSMSAALATAGFVLLTTTGCINGRLGGSQPPDLVIDELRTDNIALKAQLVTLQKNIDARLAEIDTLQQQVAGAQPLAGVDAPRVVKLEFGRYSSAVDRDGDKRDDIIRLYLKTMDQHGRFMPASGKATVQAVLLRPNKEPLTVMTVEVDPQAWDKSYRTGMTGTHFSLELPMSGTDSAALNTLKKGVHDITVMVSFTDAATGATLNLQGMYAVRR